MKAICQSCRDNRRSPTAKICEATFRIFPNMTSINLPNRAAELADVGVNRFHELVNRYVLPAPGIEQFRFEPSEESLTCGIVRGAAFA